MPAFRPRTLRALALATGAILLGAGGTARAIYLDAENTMKFGIRSYVNARVGTEQTDRTVVLETDPRGQTFKLLESHTFPQSSAGHLRQNRFYIEAEFDHDATKLLRGGFGPLALLNDLPFDLTSLRFHFTYRGEGEGIWDWGPREYRTSDAYRLLLTNAEGKYNPPATCQLGSCPDIAAVRRQAHSKGSNRHRLFQAYVEAGAGDLFIRAGRQILVWGETDAFRLLDYINPVDGSFGGFLVSLDERRVPLDMVRIGYRLGGAGDVSEASVEGFAAFDNRVSFYPGGVPGSPWSLPNLGAPGGMTKNFSFRPPRDLDSTRGGARLLFNAYSVTWSLAHYYTFADIPNVQSCVSEAFPAVRISLDKNGSGPIPGCPAPVYDLPIQQRPICTSAGSDAQYGTADDVPAGCRAPGTWDQLAPLAYTVQQPARIQVSGVSATFNVPLTTAQRLALTGEPIVRTEFAYIKDDPIHRQSHLDPFIYKLGSPNPAVTGGIDKRDTINAVLGVDHNQFIPLLNSHNSFFFSAQLFYRHVLHAPDDMVLPVPAANVAFPTMKTLGAVEPDLVDHDADQFLNTLLVATSYMSGRLTPSLAIFYDWSGALAYVPGFTFSRDPFRFRMEYDIIDAGSLKGNSGVSLVRDRDNVLFQLEYVL